MANFAESAPRAHLVYGPSCPTTLCVCGEIYLTLPYLGASVDCRRLSFRSVFKFFSGKDLVLPARRETRALSRSLGAEPWASPGESSKEPKWVVIGEGTLGGRGLYSPRTIVGCPQDPKEKSLPPQKGTHEANLCGGGVPSSHPSLGLSVFFLFFYEANLMLECSNRSEASSVGGPSE